MTVFRSFSWGNWDREVPELAHLATFVSLDYTKTHTLDAHYNGGFEFVYSVGGKFGFVVEGQPVTIRPGEAMMTCPWQLHAGRQGLFGPGKLIWCTILPEDCTPQGKLKWGPWCQMSELEQQHMGRTFALNKNPYLGKVPKLAGLLDDLQQDLCDQPPAYVAHINSILHGIIILAYRHFLSRDPEVEQQTPPCIRDIIEAIEKAPERAWSLTDICKQTKVGATTTIKWFKELTGYTPHQYVLRMRVEKAKELLLSSSSSITDIAYQLRFESSSHLTKWFKRQMDTTPSDFRKTASAETHSHYYIRLTVSAAADLLMRGASIKRALRAGEPWGIKPEELPELFLGFKDVEMKDYRSHMQTREHLTDPVRKGLVNNSRR
jgi:AraC-like DNA-binding protein